VAFRKVMLAIGRVGGCRSACFIPNKVAGVKVSAPVLAGLVGPPKNTTAAHRDLLFHNSDLNKSATICKVVDLEGFPKAFLDLETYTRS